MDIDTIASKATAVLDYQETQVALAGSGVSSVTTTSSSSGSGSSGRGTARRKFYFIHFSFFLGKSAVQKEEV